MIEGLFGGSLQSIEAALSVRALRHDLLASNLANAETPGYRALDVDFESTMRDLLGRDREGLPARLGAEPGPSRSLREALHVVGDDAPSIGNSQNTVDVDQQLAHLEQNALMYQVTAQLARQRFLGLRQVIEEGGRNR